MKRTERLVAWLTRGAVAGCFALIASHAGAADGPMDFLFTGAGAVPAADASGPTQRVWKIGEFSAIRLVPRESGAPPNQHPVQFNPERLRADLSALEAGPRGADSVPLFSTDELAPLVPALVRAFAAASPADDLLLLSTSRREGGVLSTPLSLTARLFVNDGALHLIAHDTRLDAYNAYRASRVVPALDFGSRSRNSGAALRGPAATSRRGDWVALPVADAPATAARPAAAAAPAAAARPAAAAPEPAPGRARDASFYSEQEQRLRGLKRLREQDLITEEEYQQKRREILQTL